jgi:hypothetical protein
MRASRVLAHAVAGALILGAGTVVRAADADVCAAWAGELSPLPSIDAADRFAARWARLRLVELTTLASRISATDPSAAHRLLQHARCLAPRDASVAQALAQLAPAQEVIAAPAIARAAPPVAAPPSAPARTAGKPEPPAPQLAAADAAIADASTALAQARFRDVLDARERANGLLEALGTSLEVRQRQARLEVMGGTAELALDLDADAERSLRRALRADPALVLDQSTPPKVRRLFASVRDSFEKAQQR